MAKIKLLLTYDHELPLGGCKDYNRGIFEPTKRILELADKKNVKLVLFTDICSAIQFKNWDYNGYYLPYVEQLKDAVNKFHDIELHVHPHWLTTIFENGIYHPSNDKILSHFKDKLYPLNIEGIIENSAKELNSICSLAKENYKCVAFRAGSYNIYPETERIINALKENHIKYESSVVKDYLYISDIQKEDFRGMPQKANWNILNDPKVNDLEGLFEVPVASMPVNIVERTKRIYKKFVNKDLYNSVRYNNTGFGHTGKITGIINKVTSFLNSPYILGFDFPHQDLKVLDKIIQYQLRIYKNEEQIYLCANSHPKTMGGDYHLKLMSDFIDLINTKYSDRIEFCTFHDLSNEN
jgi:hypothetical protein